jgi:predicted DNA-binding protein
MSGTRKFNDPTETNAKITLLLPADLDQQLRALAARRGSPVGPMVREWITEKLAETANDF